MTVVKNDLFDYTNRYILQDSDCFKFSLDSILLAEYVTIKNSDKLIVDMCAGNMAIPLILSKYANTNIIGFEIQKSIYELGKKSIDINNLNKQIKIINDDIKNIQEYYSSDSIDILICNPPFFKINENSYLNANESLKIARHEVKLNLDNIFSIASKFLKNKGCLYIIQRAERLDEMLSLGYKYHTYIKEIQPILTKKDSDPYMVIIKAVKGSNPGTKLKHDICVENLTTYQHIFK